MADSAQLMASAFLALMNGVAVLLISLEYRRTRGHTTYFVLLTQASVLIWHGLVILLTVLPESQLLLAGSALVILLAAASSVMAARGARSPVWRRRFFTLAITLAPAGLVMGYFFSWLPAVAWLLAAVLMCLLPVLTVLGARPDSRWLLALLQALVAFCFVVGIFLVSIGEGGDGGLFYFMMLVLIPAITLVYLQGSIQASARYLFAREQQLDVLYDSVGEIFFELSNEGDIIRLSSSIEQFGYDREALIGKPFVELLKSAGAGFEWPQELNDEPLKNQPVQLIAALGEAIDCEISATLNDIAGNKQVIGSLRNVQERKKAEHQFFEAQRRDSLGRLAAGVAHDFNNILQSVVSNAQLGLHSSSDDQVTARLKAIVDSAKVAGSICQQLLQYTGDDVARNDEINLDTVVRDVLQMLMPALPAAVELKYNIVPDDAKVIGDRKQLQQIILNLVQNAVDATRSGRVEVTLQQGVNERENAPDLSLGPEVEDSGSVFCLEVNDTGSGIDVDEISRIFEPFYSTREEGQGLGLSAVTGILGNVGGTLNVWTRVPGGTTMQILFPGQTSSRTAATPSRRHAPLGEQQTVLYAEDNDSVRMATMALLENLGFNVVAVRNGHEAVDTFSRMQDQILLFISDIRMPLKDGIEAAREICQIKPVPVLLASGYGEFGGKLSEEEFNQFHYIQKPFTLETLKTAVNDCVASSG